MQKYVSLMIIATLSVIFVKAQKKDTAYVRTFGGLGKDICYDIISTTDNGLAMVGITSSFGNGTSSFYLLKTDSNGNKKWSNTYGGDNIDVATAIKQTADKGFIIAGYTLSYGNGGYDYYLIKTDSLGKLLWEKTYGGADWEFANGIELTPDGGYLLCGKTYTNTTGGSDIFIVRTTSTGELLWSKTYGGSQDEDAKAIIITRDKNYLIVGETASVGNGREDGYLLKLTPSGDTLFTRTYGGLEYDTFAGVDTTKNGDFLIIGTTDNFNAKGYDTYIVRVNANGERIWQTTISLALDEYGYKIKELPNGEILTVGASYSIDNNGNAGMHLLRLSKDGYWQAGPVFGNSADDKGYSLTLMKNNAVAYAGYTESYGVGKEDVYLVKINNPIIVMDYTLNIKSVKDNLATVTVKEAKVAENSVVVAPNPFNQNATVYFNNNLFSNSPFSFSIYDILGKEIIRVNDVKQKQYELKAADFNKAVYIYKVISKGVILAQGRIIIY